MSQIEYLILIHCGNAMSYNLGRVAFAIKILHGVKFFPIFRNRFTSFEAYE